MGANNSSQYGSIYVSLNKQSFLTTESITGIVSANIVNSGFQHNTIYLRIKGTEFSVKTEQVNDGKEVRDNVYTLKNHIVNQTFKIHTFNMGYLPVGQIQIPFCIPPFGLNATTLQLNAHQFEIKLYFKINAFINSDPIQKKIKNKIKYKCPIVFQRPYVTITRPLTLDLNKNASTCCCISQGKCYLKAFIPITDFSAGQSASVTFEVNNSQCKLAVRNILVRLIGIVTVKFPGPVKSQVFQFWQKNIDGVGPNAPPKSFLQEFTISPQENHQNFQTSSVSQCINFSYFIQVKTILDGCTCCDDDPSISLPITVVANQNTPVLIVLPQIQPPPNWQPTIIQEQQFQFQYQQPPLDNSHFFDQSYYQGQNLSNGQNQGYNQNINQMNNNSMMNNQPYQMNQQNDEKQYLIQNNNYPSQSIPYQQQQNAPYQQQPYQAQQNNQTPYG